MDELRDGYIEGFGIFGNFVLFFWCRAVPILMIYFTTVIFIFVQQFQPSQWSIELLFVALTSGDSHIIVYSAILLMILRINLHPRITIPFFILAIIAYMVFDTYVVSIASVGVPAAIVKNIKYFIVFFALIIEFFFAKRLIVKSIIISIGLTISLFVIVVSLYLLIFFASADGSQAKDKSAQYLLRIGFKTPILYMRSMALTKRSTQYISSFLQYSSYYKIKNNFSDNEVKILLAGANLASGNQLIGNVLSKRSLLKYKDLDLWLKKRLKTKQHLGYLKHITDYASIQIKNKKNLELGPLKGNKFYILWRMDVIRESNCIKEISKIVPFLSSPDDDLSQKSYEVIRSLLNIDYSEEMNLPANHPIVINAVRDKISHLRKKGIIL